VTTPATAQILIGSVKEKIFSSEKINKICFPLWLFKTFGWKLCKMTGFGAS
jgi:hypothetical protein